MEAYHNTMSQRFDFGTVADCRPREALRLSNFDEDDSPGFRLLVVEADRRSGVLLAACDRVTAVQAEAGAVGGRSMLKLYAKSDETMGGELWKVEHAGGDYQLWYNKDVQRVAAAIKSRQPDVLGLIMPAAFRQILAREFSEGASAEEPTEWIVFAQSLCSEPPPVTTEGQETWREEVEIWIDRAIGVLCRRLRIAERIAAIEDSRP
jgi:hypothetical protein